ncbi:MAG: cytochrome c oxidase subunit II [Legionellales bacterium]|nr:cytochrome c oxidase subunit II [Legionellales bacterium]
MPNAFAESAYNLPYGVTPISHDIYNLHMITLWVCVLIGVGVFGVLFYSLYKFRKSKGAVPANFHEHLGVEIVWTVIPFLILLGLAIPATLVLKKIDNGNNPQLTIRVTGYQWKWEYAYLDQGIHFFSQLSTPEAEIQGNAAPDKWFLREVDNPLVVPVNEKVRLLITSNDVIHSWWVPELGVKQDAIPGYVNQNWFYIEKPGTYRGQCAELCGALHGFMPIVVKAVSQLEFAEWVKAHQSHVAEQTSSIPAPQAS